MPQLYQHQRNAVEAGRERNLALFHDCGCGKTATMLTIIEHLKSKGIGPALVVAPKSILWSAWEQDARMFTPGLDLVVVWDKKPSERKRKLIGPGDVFVLNYEMLRKMYDVIQLQRFEVLVVDESSKMKNPNSQITQALLSFAGVKMRGSKFKGALRIPHRYVMSGTPAPNHYGEYWSQQKLIVGPGNIGFADNYYRFRDNYFYRVELGGGRKFFRFREKLGPQILKIMGPICDVVEKDDAVDLPEQIFLTRQIELTPKERSAYETILKDKVLCLNEQTVTADHVLTELMKLRQLTSGFAYGDTGLVRVGTSKFKELMDLLDEIGDRQVIVWYNFQAEHDALRALLAPNCTSIKMDDQEAITLFKTGKRQYLLANPQNAAHGLTFTNASYAIYLSLSESYEMYKQSCDRIHRMGQDKKCTYYHLLASDTIDDQVIYPCLQRKGGLRSQAVKYFKGKGMTAEVDDGTGSGPAEKSDVGIGGPWVRPGQG